MTEWKREGRTVWAQDMAAYTIWRADVLPGSMYPNTDVESIGRLMRAAPQLRDALHRLERYVAMEAMDRNVVRKGKLIETSKSAILMKLLEDARALLREIEGDASCTPSR
jgi:hypothetical protein